MSEKKIKIVYGVNDFRVGGMQRQFVEQARLFDRERFEITLITLFSANEQKDFYSELPGEIAVHKLNFSSSYDIKSWWRLYKLLNQLKPDIVVSSLFFSNLVFRFFKLLIGYTAIAREHNTYVNKPWLMQKLDWLLSGFSYTIVAVSSTVADFTARQEGIAREKFTVIHNGIDTNKVHKILEALPDRGRLQEELGLRTDEFVFLNVSRLNSQKNHRLLIEGFAELVSSGTPAKLLILGDGSQRSELEKLTQELRLSDKVIFYGSRDDVWRFYKAADCFASTSTIEGFSNAYLEALAAGLPIVSTLTAGTDEFLEDGKNGFVIAGSELAVVAEALKRAYDANMEELRANALKAAEQFSIEDVVEEYQQLFLKAVDKG